MVNTGSPLIVPAVSAPRESIQSVNVPVFALLTDAHLKPKGIHAIFDELGIGEAGIKNFKRADQIPEFLNLVRRAYARAGRPELGEAVIKGFAEDGVQ